jgi:hypothetical protein
MRSGPTLGPQTSLVSPLPPYAFLLVNIAAPGSKQVINLRQVSNSCIDRNQQQPHLGEMAVTLIVPL